MKSVVPKKSYSPFLPIMVDIRTYRLVIEFDYGIHGFFRKWRKAGSHDIFFRLLRAFGSGNGTCDCREHQDPAQGHLRHSFTGRYQWTQRFDDLQAGFIIQPGKCLTTIEGFTIPVKGTMIVCRKLAFER